MKTFVPLLIVAAAQAQSWTPRPSGTTASLRGVSAVNAKVVWASGTGGTYLRSIDDGAIFPAAAVPGAEQLDFRGVWALDERTAYLLSSGEADKSRIYKTVDGGAHWTLQFTNPDAKGFFDAIAFWDARHGIVLGDPVDGRFVILTTSDGGEHWMRQPGPAALAKEGAFAASNSSLVVMGDREAWFASGGPDGARVFHSSDAGVSWTVASTPIRSDSASAGIFSLAFSDAKYGVAVGGDYSKPSDASHNIAVTNDGGASWLEPTGAHPGGYRSAVVFWKQLGVWITTGPSGSDISKDGGATWKQFDGGAYNALGMGWAVGPKGSVAKFNSLPIATGQR
ncbi:MAG TPA: hypothetical protein VKT81_16350 [Bryobacteraceae bacterium]|nr:hypothetical protein [Bryobacteraceae bacterium]